MKSTKYETAFIILIIKEENIRSKRTARSLQNRSIASSCSMKKHTPPSPPKVHSNNNKRPRTPAQSQTMVQASQLEILPRIYSRLFHIQFERQHTKIRFAHRRVFPVIPTAPIIQVLGYKNTHTPRPPLTCTVIST